MNSVEDPASSINENSQEQGYVPSPEDFLPTPEKPKGRLSHVPPRSGLIVALLFWLVCFYASWLYWHDPGGHGLAVSGATVFGEGEYWRLFTALFTHSDAAHLLANSPLLIIFGWLLRGYFGPWVFPITALVVGVLANLCTIIIYAPNMRLVGASGMVYGMAAMWLVFYLRFETAYPFSLRLLRVVGFILVILFPTQFQPRTSYLAHTFGFILGALAAWIWTLFPLLPTPKHAISEAVGPEKGISES